jgi:hypothetical protein
MEEQVKDATPQEENQVEEAKAPMSYEDGVIKVDLAELNKPKEDAVQEQETDAVDANKSAKTSKGVVEKVPQQQESVQTEEPVLQEITDEEVAEQVEDLQEDIQEAIAEQKYSGIELPENIQKVVEFMNETGGSLEDYVKLNTDYSALNEAQLIKEYYETTKPHLDKEDIEILMEDFSYDEELDEERDIRKKKIAFKEEAAKAKQHLEKLKNNYYEEIKAGSKLNPEQQKAVEFFNRYNKEQEETTKFAENQKNVFLERTNKVFNNDFKGFDYQVGDKKYRFNVKNAEEVKTNQSDINNFIKKFLNEKNEISDAAGYHKSLFTAMNPDAVAKHFYEQGKADAIKDSMAKAKNVNMDPRGVHETITAPNGWTVRSVNGVDSSKLRVKIRK